MQKRAILTKKPEYKYVGKESLAKVIGKAFPKQLIPTKRLGAIFGTIFIFVLLLSIFQFPLSSLISGSENISITVGYPLTFLDFSLTGAEESPLRIGGLFVDLLIYLIISYIIDILITVLIVNTFFRQKEDAEKYPKIFKNIKQNTADKVTKKIFPKPIKKQIKKEQNQPNSQPRPSKQF